MHTYKDYIVHLQQQGFDLDVVVALRKAFEEQYHSLIQALQTYNPPSQEPNWIVELRVDLLKMRKSLNTLLRQGSSRTPEDDVQMNDAFKHVCGHFLELMSQTKQLARLQKDKGGYVLVARKITSSGRI